MIISINQCNDICRVQDPRSLRHLPQRNTTGNRWGRGVDKEVCPRRSDLPRGTECARGWGEMTASHFKFPLKTDTYTLCYQIKFFVFVFFFVFENWVEQVYLWISSVSYVTGWPYRHICHTPVSALKSGCKWVYEGLEFYSTLLLSETDFASSLTCPYLFL